MRDYLLPITALVRRELVTLLRTRRSILILCCMAIGVGGLLYLTSELTSNGTFMISPAAAAQFAFQWLLVLTFPLAMVVVGPLAAISVLEERQKETFELLRLAPFTAGQIALGKILNGVGFYLLLIIAMLPVVGVLFFFAGIDIVRFVQAILISTMAAITIASIGTAVSARFNKRNTAIMMTFAGMAFVVGIPQLAVWALASYLYEVLLLTYRPDYSDGEYVMGAWMTRLPNAMHLATPLPAFRATLSANVEWWRVFLTLTGQAVVAVLAFLIARGGINTSLYAVSRSRRIVTLLEISVMVTPVQLMRASMRGYSLKDRSNPVAWLCLHSDKPVNRKFAWGVYIVALLGLLLIAHNAFDDPYTRSLDGVMMWCGTLTVVILLTIPALVSGYVTKDHETQGLDMMRMTLLQPGEIVAGHFIASLHSLLPFLMLTVLGAIPIGIHFILDVGPAGEYIFLWLCLGYLNMLLCLVFAIVAALHGSVYARGSRMGLSYAYLAVFVLYLGPGILLLLLAMTSRSSPSSGMMTVTSPLVLFGAHSLGQGGWFGYWIVTTIFFSIISVFLFFTSTLCYEVKHMRDR